MDKRKRIIGYLNATHPSILLDMWNVYCAQTRDAEPIYSTSYDFIEAMKGHSPLEFAEIICKSAENGNFNDNHLYFEFTPCGLLHSFSSICSSYCFSYDDLADYIISADNDMGFYEIREILEESKPPEYEFNFTIKLNMRTNDRNGQMIKLKKYIKERLSDELDIDISCRTIKRIEE